MTVDYAMGATPGYALVTQVGPSGDQILGSLERRRMERGKVHEQMRRIRDAYNGDMVVPTPELNSVEDSSVANLIVTGIDQTAQRIASVMPSIDYPSLRPGFKGSDEKARLRTMANQSWWDHNRMGLKMRRRARWLVGYASAPAVIRPNFKHKMPQWEIRDPLSAYPAPTQDPDDICPDDAIFTFYKSWGWLKSCYPEQAARLITIWGTGKQPSGNFQLELVEYVDAEVTVLGVLGPKQFGDQWAESMGINSTCYVELHRLPTPGGICPAVVPGRITLERPRGQFDAQIGMYALQARLMALEVIATERGIFPDTYLVGRAGETPQFISGPHDGRSGNVNVVTGGAIQTEGYAGSQQGNILIDRLERNQRITGGIPAEFGGECLRTATSQILTAKGWKSCHEVEIGDTVLTLNHETGMSEWQPILGKHVYPDGVPHKMIEMEGPRFSAFTTPNHRWPVVSGWNGARKWKTSAELTSNDLIPTAAYCAHLPAEAKWSDDLVELVGWYWTEGTGHSGGATLAQSATANPDKTERIRALLTRLYGPAKAALSKAGSDFGWTERKRADNGVVNFYIGARAAEALYEHVSKGKTPTPTPEFITSLTASQLNLLIEVAMLGDNCGPTRFGQASKASADMFSMAVVLSGRAVSFQTRHRSDPRGYKDSTTHIIRIKSRRQANPVENSRRGIATFREVDDDASVWCPTTANGTWYAREAHGTAYFTGNSTSTVRTGKRGDSIMSAVVSFPVQEAQEVLANALEEENRRAVAIDKACFGNQKKSFYYRFKDTAAAVEYVPNNTFETDVNRVTFPMTGVDANGQTVMLGQLVGMGLMSKRSAQEISPMVADPELEGDRVVSEGLEAAMLAQLQAMGQAGQIPPADLARIAQIVRQNQGNLFEAVEQVQREAQERQASAGEPGTPAGPVAPGSPEAQPGLSVPGMGAEAPIAPPPQGLDNVSSLLQMLQGA